MNPAGLVFALSGSESPGLPLTAPYSPLQADIHEEAAVNAGGVGRNESVLRILVFDRNLVDVVQGVDRGLPGLPRQFVLEAVEDGEGLLGIRAGNGRRQGFPIQVESPVFIGADPDPVQILRPVPLDPVDLVQELVVGVGGRVLLTDGNEAVVGRQQVLDGIGNGFRIGLEADPGRLAFRRRVGEGDLKVPVDRERVRQGRVLRTVQGEGGVLRRR